jgi:hypothetical protein
MTQGTRLTLQDRQVVPRVANQLLTRKATDMLGHHLTISHDAQGRGGEAHRHHCASPEGGDTIAIAIDADQGLDTGKVFLT